VSFRPAWAEIDLGAVQANAELLVKRAEELGATVCGVVKADAYGHGAARVAPVLEEAGIKWLAVALVEEGLALRDAGFAGRILLLSEPPRDAVATCLSSGVEPTVYSSRALAALAEAAGFWRGLGDGGDPRVPVHMKVDTGMHRLGVPAEEALRLAKEIAREPKLRLASVWTHLARADEDDPSPTDAQLAIFSRGVAELRSHGIAPAVVHAANSAAHLTRRDAQFDMVRVGIALYGIDPMPPGSVAGGRFPLVPALRLKARIVHARTLPPGEPVSYGGRFKTARDTVLGVVPLGYADGVRRDFGLRGGEVLVKGKRCPVVGVVTMDYLMVDVTDISSDPAAVIGEEVVLIGEQGGGSVTAWDWATTLGTSPYEVVVSLSDRIRRSYLPSGRDGG
jgi:alanine racemase